MVKLTLREKVALAICAIIVASASYLFVFYFPVIDDIERLNKMIVKREHENKKIMELTETYLKKKNNVIAFERRLASAESGFSSLTYIETVAEKSGIHENITAISPQPPVKVDRFRGTTHEIRVENVELPKIIEYIYFLENSEYLLKIDRLVLEKRYGMKDTFDARLVVLSFEKA